jgi:PD-(D/E)XK nuclease superfamily
MAVKIIWNSRDWAELIAELPVQGSLPCRTVLVPHAPVAHTLRRELIRAGRLDALAGTRFVSPRVAASEVLRNAAIEFESGEEVLRTTRLSALFGSDLSLDHFPVELLRSAPGWDDAFARTISDLEGAGLRPEDIEVAVTAPQLLDVVTIWRALDKSAARCWTFQRIYREAADALEQNPAAWPFPGPVLAYTASDFTAAEARFLRALPQVTIALLAARPVRRRYVERMEKLLGAEAAAALESAKAPRAAGSERDLLASYLFEPPVVLADPDRPRSKGPDGTVDLEEHAGVEAELEASGDWVARQVGNGVALEAIAVLVPELDPLGGLVADRLARLPWRDGDFPVHVAGGLTLTRFAAGARVLAVIRALRGHLAADLLADLAPALRLSGEADRHLSHGSAMDLLWSLGTVGGNPAWPAGALEWSNRTAERQAELEKQILDAEAAADKGNEDLDFSLRHLKRLVADIRALRPALDTLVTISRSVIQNTPLSSLWSTLREFFNQWLLQPGDVRHVILDDRLSAMASDVTCGSLAGDDALKVIEDVILSTRVPMGRFGEPAVYVGSIRGAVGLRFTAVRVIGLTEGRLPSLPREDPVISDALREALNTQNRSKNVLLPVTAHRALEDMHALDVTVRNAERVVALSAPRLDMERSEREPSSVILEAAAALSRPNRLTGERGSVIPDRTGLTRDAFIPAREEANCFRRELPLSEPAWQDGIAIRALGLPARWRGLPALNLERIEQLIDDVAPGPMDGMIGDLAAQLPMPGLSPDYPISASGIAQLLSCPHAFLLKRLLRFEEPAAPPPQREIGQPYYGLFFHDVAAEFYTSNGVAFCAHKGDVTDWFPVADRLVDGAFQEFLKQYPLFGAGVKAQQRRRLSSDLRELLRYDWDRLKDARLVTEKAFGYPKAVPLPIGTKLLHLRGRIDRIEMGGQKAVVRDLKTARAHPRIGKEANPDPGLDIQIALYGLIAEILADKWKLPKHVEAGYAYFGRPSGERVFGPDFQTLLKPAAAKWLEIAVSLLTERQFPRTPNQDDCMYCCFRPVCGDEVYARASGLLANSSGPLADFASLKMAKTQK